MPKIMSMMPPPDSCTGCGLAASGALAKGTLVAAGGGKAGAAFCCAACSCTLAPALLCTDSGASLAGTVSAVGAEELFLDLPGLVTVAAGSAGMAAAWPLPAVAAPGTGALLSAAEPGATSCSAGVPEAVDADGAASGAAAVMVPLRQACICARTSLLASVTLTACASEAVGMRRM